MAAWGTEAGGHGGGPEGLWLLDLLRRRLGSGGYGPPPPGLDWPLLLGLARREGLTPLLHLMLRAAPPGDIPPPVRERLLAGYRLAVWNNARSLSETLKLLGKLEAAGVAALPLKGPVLSHLLWGSIDARESGDMDIMIRPGDYPAAARVLEEAGYLAKHPLPPGWEALWTRHQKEMPFTRRDGRFIADLQWSVLPRAYLGEGDGDLAGGDLEEITLAGRRVRVLPPEEQLVFLSLHGLAHAWSRLEWIFSLARLLVMHPELDWGRVIRRGRELGMVRGVLAGPLLAREVLGPEVPVRPGPWRKDRSLRSLVRRLAARLWEPPITSPLISAAEPLLAARLLAAHLPALDPLRWPGFLLRLLTDPNHADMVMLSRPPDHPAALTALRLARGIFRELPKIILPGALSGRFRQGG